MGIEGGSCLENAAARVLQALVVLGCGTLTLDAIFYLATDGNHGTPPRAYVDLISDQLQPQLSCTNTYDKDTAQFFVPMSESIYFHGVPLEKNGHRFRNYYFYQKEHNVYAVDLDTEQETLLRTDETFSWEELDTQTGAHNTFSVDVYVNEETGAFDLLFKQSQQCPGRIE